MYLRWRLKDREVSVVATDGTVTVGPDPDSKELLRGVAVVAVPSREEALRWAAGASGATSGHIAACVPVVIGMISSGRPDGLSLIGVSGSRCRSGRMREGSDRCQSVTRPVEGAPRYP